MIPTPVDYKSNELTLYHSSTFADNKLRIVPRNADMTLGYMFELKTTNIAGTGNNGVLIEELYTKSSSTFGLQKVGTVLGDLQSRVSTAETNINTEITNRTNADTTLQTNITAEVSARIAADNALSTSIASAVFDAATTASNLATLITNETNARSSYDTILTTNLAAANTAITAEITRATAAELVLTNNLAAEVTNRTNAITTEAAARAAADTQMALDISALSSGSTSGLNAEIARATAAEASLQSQITNILSNTDTTALNSLAELVADYGNYNTSLVSRVTYLEQVIAQLVNKQQSP
jgi:hypothetical protein